MLLIEQRIKEMVTEAIRMALTERLVKVLEKLPNTLPIDTENMTRHYKKGRKKRNNIINDLGGYGKPIASFKVFDYESNSEKIHTITDNGICIIQDVDTYNIITMFPITLNKIKQYWKQLTNKPNPKLPYRIWNNRQNIDQFHNDFTRVENNAVTHPKP